MTEYHERYMVPCTQWVTEGDSGHYCGATPTKHFLPGRRCQKHTPARINGRPETKPDPTRTLVGLREAAGIPQSTTATAAPTVVDHRAVKDGKRRASTAAVRAAREQIAGKR